jgi:hydroxyethylthiazole kinase-like uncharacterized protein yjeF
VVERCFNQKVERSMRIANANEMRELDRRAIEEYGIPSTDLMESAGRALSKKVQSITDSDSSITLLCGPGNNGGDGLACALDLVQANREVTVFLVAETNKLGRDPLYFYRRVAESQIQLYSLGDAGYQQIFETISNSDVIVDALLGIGSQLPLRGEIKSLVEYLSESYVRIVSADIPTGIDCDTGVAVGSYVRANYTVAFGLLKPCFFQNEGIVAAGQWSVEDIGYPQSLLEDTGTSETIAISDVWFQLPRRVATDHKRTVGVVLVIAGCERYPGAAALCARGAMRAGAGLVTVGSIPWVLQGVRSGLPECTLLELQQEEKGIGLPSDFDIQNVASDYDVIAIGPGLGRAQATGQFLKNLFANMMHSWVVDGDALYWMSELGIKPQGEFVMTPHEGEAARLLGWSAEEVRKKRFDAARTLADRYECTVILKGAYSLVTSKDSDITVNITGNAGLATAGTGDVLTGVVAAYFAATGCAETAAKMGVFLQGLSADGVSKSIGEYGYLASEVADHIPTALSVLDKFMLDQHDVEEWDEDDSNFEDN